MGEAWAFRELLAEVEGGVCTLTLNRPQRKNALSPWLVAELTLALERAASEPAVRCVVLTGAGAQFCAGADLAGFGASEPLPREGGFPALLLAFEGVGKPVIGKVRGYALAGAIGLVCACHLVVCDEATSFGLPEIDRGIWPMMVMAGLFRVVGRRHGLELCLTGERIGAARAEQIGLVSRVVPADRLDAEVAELAAKLAGKPRHAVRLGLSAFYEQEGAPTAEALPRLQERLAEVLASPDAAEGLAAFLQKRTPNWD